MTVQDLIDKDIFRVVNKGSETARNISGIYCCDLLSFAMGRAPESCAWVTVMGNINTLAVASLADVSCVIMAEGVSLDDTVRDKAREQGITILATDKPVFDAALEIYHNIHA